MMITSALSWNSTLWEMGAPVGDLSPSLRRTELHEYVADVTGPVSLRSGGGGWGNGRKG